MAFAWDLLAIGAVAGLAGGALRACCQSVERRNPWLYNSLAGVCFGALIGLIAARFWNWLPGFTNRVVAFALLALLLGYVGADFFQSFIAVAQKPPWRLRKPLVIIWR